ncbi:MAG: biopolymer transporter ExbD [Cellvibrionaceae bacterium]|nr:biopolymer transporter ExbD [Cellvibrionaceae bacterium]
MSRRKRKQSSEDKAEIDLTPMLDVVFIMLIFFIVTASFIKEKSLSVNVPENTENPPPPDEESKSILVQINSNNEIYIDGRRVDVRSVRSLIAQKKAENPQGGVVVLANELAKTEAYIAVADAAREANVYNVSLVPRKD